METAIFVTVVFALVAIVVSVAVAITYARDPQPFYQSPPLFSSSSRLKWTPLSTNNPDMSDSAIRERCLQMVISGRSAGSDVPHRNGATQAAETLFEYIKSGTIDAGKKLES